MTAVLEKPVARPALRWHGGKWMLMPWIVSHFPPHRVYVEPFGGAASVLLRKPRSYAEVYNDLDDEVVGYFRVLRDRATAAELERLLRLTLFARAEFEGAYGPTADPVERARRLVIRSFMGFGSDGHNAAVKTGFRANSNRSGTSPSQDWANWPDGIAALTERMQGVVIENRAAMEVMAQHDGDGTLCYVDPPYVPATRSNKSKERTMFDITKPITRRDGTPARIVCTDANTGRPKERLVVLVRDGGFGGERPHVYHESGRHFGGMGTRKQHPFDLVNC